VERRGGDSPKGKKEQTIPASTGVLEVKAGGNRIEGRPGICDGITNKLISSERGEENYRTTGSGEKGGVKRSVSYSHGRIQKQKGGRTTR